MQFLITPFLTVLPTLPLTSRRQAALIDRVDALLVVKDDFASIWEMNGYTIHRPNVCPFIDHLPDVAPAGHPDSAWAALRLSYVSQVVLPALRCPPAGCISYSLSTGAPMRVDDAPSRSAHRASTWSPLLEGSAVPIVPPERRGNSGSPAVTRPQHCYTTAER